MSVCHRKDGCRSIELLVLGFSTYNRLMRREPLSELKVVVQCHETWASMNGTERVRHCSQCGRNVFNISNMTHSDAVDLVRRMEGRACVRYYQRQDGTILTRDCSVRDRVSLFVRLRLATICGVLGITMTTGCIGSTGSGDKDLPPSVNSKSDFSIEHLSRDEGSNRHQKPHQKSRLPVEYRTSHFRWTWLYDGVRSVSID